MLPLTTCVAIQECLFYDYDAAPGGFWCCFACPVGGRISSEAAACASSSRCVESLMARTDDRWRRAKPVLRRLDRAAKEGRRHLGQVPFLVFFSSSSPYGPTFFFYSIRFVFFFYLLLLLPQNTQSPGDEKRNYVVISRGPPGGTVISIFGGYPSAQCAGKRAPDIRSCSVPFLGRNEKKKNIPRTRRVQVRLKSLRRISCD